jgi:hypothetical protein
MSLTKVTYSMIADAPINPKDYGAVGDGVANDSAAIQAAFAAGNNILFTEGTYYLGEYNSSNDAVINLSNKTVVVQNSGKVTFTLRTATGVGDCYPTVFRLYNSPNCVFGDFYFEDLNADLSTTNRRALKPYRLTADGTTGTWGDVSISRIYCHNTIDAIAFDGADAVNRVKNITIQEIHLDNCYYGVQGQNQGDNVIVGAIYGNQVRRIYFIYGVQNHRATIYDKNHLGSTGTVFIQRTLSGGGVGSFPTKDVYINYTCYETSAVQTIVRIQHGDLLGGTIENINLTLNVDVPVSSRPVYFVNLDSAGNESSAASLNVVNEIYINGRFGATADNIVTTASYATNTGSVYVPAEGAVIDSSTTAVKFIVRDKPITYTPVWSTSGTAPVLGNGTLTGNYEIVRDVCNFFISFTAGSTTTFGTGAFEFTLPKQAAYDQVLTIWGEDNGVANYTGLGLFGGASRTTVYGVSNASGATWSASAPFAWGSGDRIRISGSYVVAN